MLSRLSLRLKVALAFAATTALALVMLGIFVHFRVQTSLEEHLHDLLHSEMDALVALPPADRLASASATNGEVFVQVVGTSGSRSSPRLHSAVVTARSPAGYSNRTVALSDDEGTESERCLVLVRRIDGQVLAVGTERSDSDAAAASIRTQLLVGGPIALAMASLLGYLVSGAGLKPIERMREQAATISARSSSERLPLPVANDEVRRLGITLNAMLDRLDGALQRERRFVAEASHELRTPLALLRTELDLALDRPRTPDELTLAVESAREETARLISLANDLLSLAGADSSYRSLQRSRIDVGSLLSAVVVRFRPTAQMADRSITSYVEAPIAIDADRARLEQVISNLVDNALRHGRGDISVTASATSTGQVTIDVADEGPGIPEDLIARSGELFNHEATGRGLGLAIVRAIVEAHGGHLEVSGAHVAVFLPTSQD